MRRLQPYIYQKPTWPSFYWKQERLTHLLGKVRHLQGKIVGRMESLGFDMQREAVLETLTQDVLKSTEIEGEFLNAQQVRSSVARRLGLEISGLVPSDRNVDGVVDMMLDATQRYNEPLTKDRLFGWHTSLFPEGRSGMYKVLVGRWRDDSTGPMQVVSGALGKEKVHFEAPPAGKVEAEMDNFLLWLNENNTNDPVIKAGIAHLWFVTIHPFEDGNGRVARAIADMLLARADGMPQRFYSMSAQIRKERKEYYDALEKTQQGDVDITGWLDWFLNCLFNALNASYKVLDAVIFKHDFWVKNSLVIDNERQKLMLSKLLDGFEDNLTTSKWAKIASCSPDTALRDIQDLIAKQILRKAAGGGRSTHYELAE